jgi:hypothetical protein
MTSILHYGTSFHINASLKAIQFEGQDHVVVPVVLLTEGIHAGSDGPIFYSSSALAKSAHLWNGVPVPVNHPVSNCGTPISCNSPDVIQSHSVGRLWNVYWDSSSKKLKGEIYINVAKVKRVNPVVMEYLTSNKPLEVSTGLFSTDSFTNGVWNTKKYGKAVQDIYPDHLALLPNGKGACSWEDGCGVRANQKGGMKMDMEGVFGRVSKWFRSFISNEMSYSDREREIRDAIYALDDANNSHSICDIYDTYVIYSVRQIVAGGMPGGECKTYKQTYAFDDAGEVTLVGDSTEVERVISYEPVTANVAERKDVSPKAGTSEYGDVTFADEKNNKYPIDTEAHIRAAWNYINVQSNADKYPPADVTAIKAKIVKAWKAKIDTAGPPSAKNNMMVESARYSRHIYGD